MNPEQLQQELAQTAEMLPFDSLSEAATLLHDARYILAQVLEGSSAPLAGDIIGAESDVQQHLQETTRQLHAMEVLLIGYSRTVESGSSDDIPTVKGKPAQHRLTAQTVLTERQSSRLTEITDAAQKLATERFGDGFPNFEKLGHTALRYHNGAHSKSVKQKAVIVGENVGLSGLDLKIVAAAASAHDLVQDQGSGQNEIQSAAWLAKELRKKDIFEEDKIRTAEKEILGTEVVIENGILIDQMANRLEYSSKSEELGTKSVSSGDLGSLYTPEGPRQSHELYREIKGMNGSETPEIDNDLVVFQRNNLILVTNHRYPLREAETLLATHRSEVITYHGHVLGQLERGEIHTWQQLIDQDNAFYRKYS